MANDGVDNYGHWWKNRDNIRICVLASLIKLCEFMFLFINNLCNFDCGFTSRRGNSRHQGRLYYCSTLRSGPCEQVACEQT